MNLPTIIKPEDFKNRCTNAFNEIINDMINFRNPYCYFRKLTYRQIFPTVYCFSQPCLELLFAIEAGYFFDSVKNESALFQRPAPQFILILQIFNSLNCLKSILIASECCQTEVSLTMCTKA